MKIQIIGSGSMWTKFNSACYLINDEIMIDFNLEHSLNKLDDISFNFDGNLIVV